MTRNEELLAGYVAQLQYRIAKLEGKSEIEAKQVGVNALTYLVGLLGDAPVHPAVLGSKIRETLDINIETSDRF